MIKKWDEQELEILYNCVKNGLSYPDICLKLKSNERSESQCKEMYQSVDWNEFFNKKKEVININQRKWTDVEKKTLHDLKTKTTLSYEDIGKKLHRSSRSVSDMFKKTDWKVFFKNFKSNKESNISKQLIQDIYIDNLTKALIEISRHDIKRLRKVTKQYFLQNTILPSKTLPISFLELKHKAIYELEQIGFSFPSSKVLGKGTYIIVGDTHGKHTRSGMFKLINNLAKHINAKKIIHIGHFIDDDNDYNYNWDKTENLCIIAKEEELKFLAKAHLRHEIVRNEILLGDHLSIQNQDLITDYAQTALWHGITPEYFELSTITNLHRHEFNTRCTEEGAFSYVASPGCLCEKHIVYTIKQQDFTDGRTVKQTFPTGYKKYRRMKHMYKTWQQGCVIVEVDSDGNAYVNMCRIQQTSKGYTTSYFDKIITENEILNPDDKTLIISDLHVDYHDENILDIEEQIASEYKPNTLINLGDITENKPINHHEFQKAGSTHIEQSLLKQSATNNFILNRTSKWANKMILLIGNHERFYEDYYNKNPQFTEILNFKFINGVSDLDIEIIDLKKMKKHGNANYIHGDLLLIGQKGESKLDKLFRTYGRNTVMGHCHYASCRFDCYTVSLSGKLDLEYNETNASSWSQGCATCNTFEDLAFISNILIIGNKTQINNKVFKPQHTNSWKIPNFTAKIQFDFER